MTRSRQTDSDCIWPNRSCFTSKSVVLLSTPPQKKITSSEQINLNIRFGGGLMQGFDAPREVSQALRRHKAGLLSSELSGDVCAS